MARTMRVALGMALAMGAQGFNPFADVEELKPQRLEQFCDKGFLPDKDGRPSRLRRCKHLIKKKLDDGGDVTLGWTMNADPDSILSLDTEAEHGVKLTRCSPEELEIALPESHLRHAQVGTVVVGSQHSHQCTHLPKKTFLHKITEVGEHTMDPEGLVRVRLGAQALAGIQHAVPYLNFHFSYMPVEATDLREFPEMVTDWGLNREFLKKQKEKKEGITETKEGKDRRLLPSLSDMADSMQSGLNNLDNVQGVQEDDGNFQSGGTSGSAFNTQNSFLNLQPKQVSNFGWNWNFFMNTTEAPNYNMNMPGIAGWMRLRHPFIRIHAGIYLNFTSEFTGLTVAPLVKWTAGINGHGNVEARVLSSLNTTDDTQTDPFHAFKLPVLEHLEEPKWFQEVEFATGQLPIKFEPGFQFQASMYHSGTFHGAVGIGGKTRGVLQPSLTYDSQLGFESNFTGHLIDTEIWPPLWLIFTRKFELGIMGMPAILMKGDFAGIEQATLAFQGRPYLNITVTREGSPTAAAPGTAGEVKTLTAYPYRVSGLTTVDFHTTYKVQVTANGQTIESNSTINWGDVEFKEDVTKWDFGQLPQQTLMSDTITVTLVEVNDASGSPTETILGSGTVACTSLLASECQPTPSSAVITSSSGSAVATVDLAIVWDNSPVPWLASKIRGIIVGFPQITLRQDTLEASFPNAVAPAGESSASGFKLHLGYGGKTYVSGVAGSISQSSSTLAGDTTIDFGPTVIQNWLPCAASPCESPKLDLYYGNTKVGTADIPPLDLSSQTAMQGTSGSSFMGGSSTSSSTMNVPATVSLYAPGSTTATIAEVSLNMNVVMPLSSSLFLMPRAASQVAQGTPQTFAWTVANVDSSLEYAFTLTAYKLTTVSTSSMQSGAHVNDGRVGSKVLVEVDGSATEVNQHCVGRATNGMAADQAPCSFETTYSLGSSFAVGDQIVVQISWTADSSSHVMTSPPIEIVSQVPGGGRRLVGAPERRLWSQENWNARISEHNASCQQRDLHFTLGAGMLVRGQVEQVDVPDGFPMIGGASNEPLLATQWRRIAGTNGTDLMDLLGGEDNPLCQEGMCQGALPGCSEGGSKKMTFPTLVFDFNRPMYFANNGTAGHFHGMMKQALAYAFSALPEMVDIMIKEANERREAEQANPSPAPAPSSGWFSVTNNAHTTAAPAAAVQWPMNQVTQTQAPSAAASPATTTVPSAFNHWWGGSGMGRRLQEVDDSVPQTHDEMPKELGRHQVALRFPNGMPFIVDRPLVEMMQRSGHFMEVGDVQDDAAEEHGKLEITGFYIDSGVPLDWKASADDKQSEGGDLYMHGGEEQKAVASPSTTIMQGLTLAAVGGCAALLVAVVMSKQSPRSAQYAPSRSHVAELLEPAEGME